ncbi:hypothetical protein B9G55_20595 [Saccharibacillus sp. O16]|nr:hypothetical protein B9G55_20595 [Saccharibacillus sp. O16]
MERQICYGEELMMRRIPKWAAISLIVVGGIGLALNFSDLKISGAQIDRTAAIAPDHIQQAGSSAASSAVVVDSAAVKGTDRLQEIRKRWEFKSGALKNLSLSSVDNVHIEVKTDTTTDYVELRGVVSEEAAERATSAVGESDGLALDLTGSTKFSLLSIGSTQHDVYMTLGLRDAKQLEKADFLLGSGAGDFDDFYARQLQVDLSSGELTANRLSGDQISLDLTSGRVEVKDLIGESQIELSSGMVQIDGLEGNSVIKATSGMVDLTQKTSGNLDVEISSGKADIRAAKDFKGVYDLHVTSGLVQAPESPGTSGDTIKVRATSGIITIK